MATMRMINATRRNAELSTGPKTDEGKLQSRRNALKHGLAGKGVVLPEEMTAAVQERMEQWHSSIKPFDPVETFLFEELCLESVRIEAPNFGLVDHKRRQVERARRHWEDDRTL